MILILPTKPPVSLVHVFAERVLDSWLSASTGKSHCVASFPDCAHFPGGHHGSPSVGTWAFRAFCTR
jgi:hypothetical protein